MRLLLSEVTRTLVRHLVAGLLVLCTAAGTLWASEIHDAAREGDLSKVMELVEQYPEMANEYDSAGLTPLHHAALEDRILVIKFLLSNGVLPDVRKGKGPTPLYLAVDSDSEEAVEYLISQGANVNLTFEKGRTVLFHAVSRRSSNVVQLLIQSGASVNAGDIDGYTPLHIAAIQNLDDMADLLLVNGANSSAKLIRPGGTGLCAGDTPLHAAVAFNSMGVVELLLRNRVPINEKNKAGLTPLYYAKSYKRDSIYTLLKKSGGK